MKKRSKKSAIAAKPKSKDKKNKKLKTAKGRKKSSAAKKKSKPRVRYDDSSSSSSSSESGKSDRLQDKSANFVLVSLPTSKERTVMPGHLELKQSPDYLMNILADERPDLMFSTKLSQTEADCLDKHLKSLAELTDGDEFLIEDANGYVQYEIKSKYNEGRYAALYIVTRSAWKNNKQVEDKGIYMMKTQLRKGSARCPLFMKRENAVLKAMGGKKNKKKFWPGLVDYGKVCDMPFLVMTLLDKNLEKFRAELGAPLSLVTSFFVAKEVLGALEELHSKNYIHRDVKPANMAFGIGKETTRIFLMDFGDTVKSGKAIKLGVADALTLPYWSLDCHRRARVSAKTDLDSWLFTLVDLSVGLSWKNNLNTEEVAKAKEHFSKEYQTILTQPTLLQVAEIVATSDLSQKAVYAKLSQILTDAMGTAKFVPEWIKKK